MMNRIKTERTVHRNQAVVKLLFDYDTALVAEVRKALPEARWSKTMRCWWVADTPQAAKALSAMGIEAATNPVPAAAHDKPEAQAENGDLLTRFADYMRERRYSPRTVESYTECLRIFFNYHHGKDVLDIGNEDVEDFNRNYILKKRLSATYQSQFVNAIKLFYGKIPRKRLVLEHIERPKRGRPLPKVLSKDDVAQIINATNNLKHRAMLSLLYSCGLRRGELLDMRIADIDSKRNMVNVRHGKGDKDRQVPLSPKILEMLRDYFKQYRPVTWLFEGDKPDTPYSAESLHKVFTAAKRKAGITAPFKLHGLRHCYATHLMEAGVGLRYIQELLGHRHIKTTEIYTHVSSEVIQKIQSPFDTLNL